MCVCVEMINCSESGNMREIWEKLAKPSRSPCHTFILPIILSCSSFDDL